MSGLSPWWQVPPWFSYRAQPKPAPADFRPGRRPAALPWVALRSLLFLLFLALVTAPYSLFAMMVRPLSPQWRYWLISRWAVIIAWAIRYLLGIRWHFEGLETFPQQPCVILAKHQSACETIVLPAELAPMVFVFKKELLRVPFFGWGIGSCPMIPIDRSAGRDAIDQIVTIGRERLSQGFYVTLFPEGTRVAVGETRRYKAGGAKLAEEAGVVVVPVAHNAGELWARNAFLRYPGDLLFVIGPPIETRGKRVEAVNDEVASWIESEMRRRFPWHYRQEANTNGAGGS